MEGVKMNSLLLFSVVEKIAGFNVSVDDVMEVDIGKSCKQGIHVISGLNQSHGGKVVLATGEGKVRMQNGGLLL